MKKPVFIIIAIVGLFVPMGTVLAGPILNPIYQDIDSFGVTLNADHPSQSGIFNITSGDNSPPVIINSTGNAGNRYLNAGTTYSDIVGFVPGGPVSILSAHAYFYIRNANGQNDTVTIDLTGFLLGSADFQGDASHIIFGGGLDAGAIDLLNNNGELSYTVSRDSGSFIFDYAQLQVEAVGVPDGGSTAVMLSCALLLTGVVGRRLNLIPVSKHTL